MAIGTIKIYKLDSKEAIGCYEISSNHYDFNKFYMCIDKKQKIITFYLTKNFSSEPIHVLDYNKNDRLGMIPGVPTRVLSIAVCQALRSFEMDTFPDSLSFSA